MAETLQNGEPETANPQTDCSAAPANTTAAAIDAGQTGANFEAAASIATPMPAVRRRWQRCTVPPFPPPTGCRRVVLPLYGFVLDADDDHRRRVDRFFNVPMLVLSLLVLPILAAQYYFSSRLRHPWIPYVLEAAFLLVSIAFMVEFVVKVAIARSRLRYALANWLDIVIIILPFLRPFRAARVLRVAQLLPAYSFKGVYGKLIRTAPAVIMGTTLVQRVRRRFAPPGKPAVTPGQTAPDYSQWSKAALIAEIQRLNEQLREVRNGERDI